MNHLTQTPESSDLFVPEIRPDAMGATELLPKLSIGYMKELASAGMGPRLATEIVGELVRRLEERRRWHIVTAIVLCVFAAVDLLLLLAVTK